MKTIKLVVLLIFTAALGYSSGQPASAQTTFTGTWNIERRDDRDRNDKDREDKGRWDKKSDFQLSLQRHWDNGNSNHSSGYKFSDFEGLSAQDKPRPTT